MSRPGRPRVTPAVPSSPLPAPASAPREPRHLQAALGGGRRRGADDAAPAAAVARELWLAVHLPHHVLESLLTGAGQAVHAAAAPVAVVDVERGARVVCDRDARAAAGGVLPGMALNSALALQPGLQVLAREPRREQELLAAVATAALDFTPRVTLEPPDAVLLEVRGSLRLFGGPRRLCERLRDTLRARGVEPRLALTPAPLASLWFARAGAELLLRRPEVLPARLAPLPLAVTRWPAQALQGLVTMGVRTVGDCLRLPRDGFARRFAPRLRLDLDRALGRAPDPRAAFVASERFTAYRELEPELADTGRLQHALEPLLGQLCEFLRGRGRGVETLELRLLHRDAPATRLRQRFIEPVAAVERIAPLLRERLARAELPGPVRAVRVRSGPLVEAPSVSHELFALGCRRGSAVPQLVERLQARLGADAVHGLCLVPEHRPEKNGDMHRFSSPSPLQARMDPKSGECPHFPRPVWLLATPLPLAAGEQPCYEGPLEIESGPERIESGWWDGHDVRRDYYVARSRGGARLWVFRERRAERRWFLHGVFG